MPQEGDEHGKSESDYYDCCYISIKELIIKNATKTIGGISIYEILEGRNIVDKNEWLIYCITEFYNQLVMIYGSVMHQCTEETCPTMAACKGYQYTWNADQNDGFQIITATDYIKKLFKWAGTEISKHTETDMTDENFNAQASLKSIFRRFFRVYAHMYYHHIDYIIAEKMIHHLNMSFRHFLILCLRMNLLSKIEIKPLEFLLPIFNEGIYEEIADNLTDKNKIQVEKPERSPQKLSLSNNETYHMTVKKLCDNDQAKENLGEAELFAEQGYPMLLSVGRDDTYLSRCASEKGFLGHIKSSILNVARKSLTSSKKPTREDSDLIESEFHSCLQLSSSSKSSSRSGNVKFVKRTRSP